MADRYQNRRFPTDNYDRSDDQHGRDESDPLAELARLIGQTDPFGNFAKAAPPPRSVARERYQPPYEPPALEDEAPPAGPPPWMQRANARAVQREAERDTPPPQQDYANSVHPLHRYAQPPAPEQPYVEEPAHEAEEQLDPSRYDDALYDQIETGAQDYQREPAYPDDPYAYQDGYDDKVEARGPRRRGRLVMVAAILVLAVVGTGAAFAYRTYMGSPRSGEPPIIRADNSPTKIVPAPADGTTKAPDRMPSGDGTEKVVSREEAPVDINAQSGGPRVVFPPLNTNTNPPTPASVSTTTVPAPASAGGGAAPTAPTAPTSGTLPNNEPRKIKTLSVRGDQAEGTAGPVGVQAPAPPAKSAAAKTVRTAATASGNGPLSLAPDAAPPPVAETRTRVATTTNPPLSSPNAGAASGAYMVQVSSQRSESDAQASFKALQNKFPSVLGSQTPVIKRADLGEKGVYYRAMVGPFGTPEEASQLCGNLKSAGGQCVVQRN